jgi:hypothetical protein
MFTSTALMHPIANEESITKSNNQNESTRYEPIKFDLIKTQLEKKSKNELALASLMIPSSNKTAEYLLSFDHLPKDVNLIVLTYFQDFIENFKKISEVIPSKIYLEKDLFFSFILQYPELITYQYEDDNCKKYNVFDSVFLFFDHHRIEPLLQKKDTLNILLDRAILALGFDQIIFLLQQMTFTLLKDKNGLIITKPSEEDKRFIKEKIEILRSVNIDLDLELRTERGIRYIHCYNYLSNPHIASQRDKSRKDINNSLSNAAKLLDLLTTKEFKKIASCLLDAAPDYLYVKDNNNFCNLLEVVIEKLIESKPEEELHLSKVFDKILPCYSAPFAMEICGPFLSAPKSLKKPELKEAILTILQKKLQHETGKPIDVPTETIIVHKNVSDVIKNVIKKPTYSERISFTRMPLTNEPDSIQWQNINNNASLEELYRKFNDCVDDYKGSFERKNAINRIRVSFQTLISDCLLPSEQRLKLMLGCLIHEHSLATIQHSKNFFKIKKQSELAKRINLLLEKSNLQDDSRDFYRTSYIKYASSDFTAPSAMNYLSLK